MKTLLARASAAGAAAALSAAPAHAGAAAPAGPSMLVQIAPLILIFVVFYFLLIRPQQKRMKDHREMVAALRRGDVVVTSGGMVGKIVRVRDGEGDVLVEFGEADPKFRVNVVRATISEVRSKTEPAPANDAEPE